MLKVDMINVAYNGFQVLWDVSLEVNEGEVVVLLGSNGAGKTTTLKTVSGILHPISGSITFLNKRIDKLPPHRIVEMGIVHVPQGRKLFPKMTVIENLEIGAITPDAVKRKKDSLESVFNFFPVLKERRNQLAGTLSGGEQQMLAIARGLMARPKCLMLDEPSLGLGPIFVSKIFTLMKRIKEEGMTILLVEQNVKQALKLADRGYVMETGRIILEGKKEDLMKNELIKKAYIGM